MSIMNARAPPRSKSLIPVLVIICVDSHRSNWKNNHELHRLLPLLVRAETLSFLSHLRFTICSVCEAGPPQWSILFFIIFHFYSEVVNIYCTSLSIEHSYCGYSNQICTGYIHVGKDSVSTTHNSTHYVVVFMSHGLCDSLSCFFIILINDNTVLILCATLMCSDFRPGLKGRHVCCCCFRKAINALHEVPEGPLPLS